MDIMSLPQQQLAQIHHPPIHHGQHHHLLQTPDLMSSDENSAVALDSNFDFERPSFEHHIAPEAIQASSRSLAPPKQVSAYLCINLDSSQQHQQSGQSFIINKTDLDLLTRQNAQVVGSNQVTIPITVPASLLAPISSISNYAAVTTSTLSASLPPPPKTPTFASLNEHSSWLDQWFSSETIQKHNRNNSMVNLPIPIYKYEADETRNHAHVIECLSGSSSNQLHNSFSTPMLFSKSKEEAKAENTRCKIEDEWIFPQASTPFLHLTNSTTDADVQAWQGATFQDEVFAEMSPLSKPRALPRLEDSERRMSSSSQGTKRSFTAEFDALDCSNSEYPQKRKFVRGIQGSLDDPSTRLARYPTEFDRNVEPSYTLTDYMALEPRVSDSNQGLVPYPGIGEEGEALFKVSNSPDNSEIDENIINQEPLRSDDLYTPLWTRYEGDARQGWCRFCPAHQHNNWYSIKRSQYM